MRRKKKRNKRWIKKEMKDKVKEWKWKRVPGKKKQQIMEKKIEERKEEWN